MVQILPQEPGLGELLGTGIGTGIGTGVKEGISTGLKTKLKLMQQVPAAQAKLQEQEQRQVRALLLAKAGGLDVNDVAGLDVSEVSQLIRSKAEEKKAEARSGEIGQKQVESAFKITAPVRKEINAGARSARDTISRLDRMEALIDKGTLISPVYNETLKKMGLDIPALKNPDSQEFEKLTADMTRNIRDSFGARITTFELEVFLKSIPTLSQTAEGKRRVIENRKILEEGKQVRSKAMTEILRENNGVPPLDLEEQVDERADGELDALSQKFKAGVERIEAPGGPSESLSRDQALDFLKQAKGSKEKARELARKQGFVF